jgi:hypothetical protein
LTRSSIEIRSVSTPASELGVDTLGVPGVGEHDLAGEHARRTLGQLHLRIVHALTADEDIRQFDFPHVLSRRLKNER